MAVAGPSVLRFQNGPPARRQFGERLRLIVKEGAQKNSCFCLIGSKLSLGRETSCDIVLEDTKVSRRHLQIEWNGTVYTAKNQGTPNGFIINGRKVIAESAVNPGDTLVVGLTVLDVQGIDATGKKINGSLAAGGNKSGAMDPKIARARIIVGGGLVLVLLLIFSESGERVKTFRERAKIDISTETEKEAKPKKDDLKSALAAVTPNYSDGGSNTDAGKFFRLGVRELQNKNYRRALTNFDTTLSVDPGHELAKIYKEIARRDFEREVDVAMKAAIRARKALRYSEARMHYQVVVNYLEGDKDNVQYVEAKEALRLLDKMEEESPQ